MRSFQFAVGVILLLGLLASVGCVSDSAKSSTGFDASTTSGGADAIADSVATEAAAPVNTPSNVVNDGYVATGPWAGPGFTATDPGAAQIIPNCGGATCNPPFAGRSFCMHGTVTGRNDYTGFAMLGWNVSQDSVGGAPLTWAVPDAGGIIVTVDNPSNTPLRIQLQGTDPHSSADRWCVPLVSGQFVPWSSFLTNCWPTGSPHNALTPGTPLQQAAILVPGLQVDLPFDFCLVDVQIQ